MVDHTPPKPVLVKMERPDVFLPYRDLTEFETVCRMLADVGEELDTMQGEAPAEELQERGRQMIRERFAEELERYALSLKEKIAEVDEERREVMAARGAKPLGKGE